VGAQVRLQAPQTEATKGETRVSGWLMLVMLFGFVPIVYLQEDLLRGWEEA
jgi:hypothetical protein